MLSSLRQLFRRRTIIPENPTPIPKTELIQGLRPKYPINVVEEEPEILSEIEALNPDVIDLNKFRNNNREMDPKLFKLYNSYISESNPRNVKEVFSELNDYESLIIDYLRNNRFFKDANFILTVLQDVDVEASQYLTIKEITLFIFYLYLVLKKIFTSDIYSSYTNYKSLIKLYETIFEDIYYTFDIDYPIYNSLMTEMDKELSYRLSTSIDQSLSETNKLISDIYIKYLIYCLLLTPLNKMGDYDNTINFFKNYLAYLTIIIPDTDGEYKRTRYWFSVKKDLLPSSWLVN